MRRRAKKIRSIDASKLEPLDSKWLDLPGVKVEGKLAELERIIVVQTRTTCDAMPACPKCKLHEQVIKWGFQVDRNIRDAERNGKLVLIVLRAQKFRCKKCRKKFNPPLQFLERNGMGRTKRLADKAKGLSYEHRTTSDVAVQTGLSRRTIQNIAREGAKNLPTPQEIFRKVTSKGKGHVVQIDNAHPSWGECTAILLNAKPLELSEQYNQAEIEKFLVTLGGHENVTCYISDLAPFLLNLGRKYFRKATIVADPHHVVKRILEDFDKLLKRFEDAMLSEYIRAIDEKCIVRPVRPKRGKVKKNGRKDEDASKTNNDEEEEKLRKPTDAEIRILLHTKIGETNGTHKKAVQFLIRRFPEVRSAYFYMQHVMALYHTKISAADVSRALNKYEAKLPVTTREGLSTFLSSCRRNRDAICAFWSMGWTNAEIESQNGIIKEIDRKARGLEFEELRRRWLYGKSMSAILEREKEKVLGNKKGPRKKGIRELSKQPPPEPMPVVGEGGEQWLFGWPKQSENT
jgi:transposase